MMGENLKKEKMDLSEEAVRELIDRLKLRFEQNRNRHPGIEWSVVQDRLLGNPEKLWSLYEMERSGGEPDVVGDDPKNGKVVFFDCALESPKVRRSLCYDNEAWESRKANKPVHSALGMARDMGIEILTEQDYYKLQEVLKVDEKTSSWLLTPEPVRSLGGALFGDRRYDQVFIYHNGAESYYASRGFRGKLEV